MRDYPLRLKGFLLAWLMPYLSARRPVDDAPSKSHEGVVRVESFLAQHLGGLCE